MKRLLIILLFLIFGVWVGSKIVNDPGYVLLANRHWSFETPLWFGVLLLLVSFVVTYFLVRLISNAVSLPKRMKFWSRQRQQRRFQRLYNQGYTALINNNWRVAEKKLKQVWPRHSLAWVALSDAARAAHAQQAYERRDDYWQQAYQSNLDAELCIGLQQVELLLQQQRYEQAFAILQRVQPISEGSNKFFQLLAETYLHLAEWEKLKLLLVQLSDNKNLSTLEQQQLEEKTYLALLKSMPATTDLDKLQFFWQNLSKSAQENPVLIHAYVLLLIANGGDQIAERLLRKMLGKQWSGEVIKDFARVHAKDPVKQLQMVEAWLHDHPTDANLLLACGKLCLRNHLWGKARSYLETSLSYQPQVETYQALVELFNQIHEPELALDYAMQGLELAGRR